MGSLGVGRSNLDRSTSQAFADECVPSPADYITSAVASNALTPLLIPEPSGRDEALHQSVVFAPGGWNGCRYWMLYTPDDFSAASNANGVPYLSSSTNGVNWTPLAAPVLSGTYNRTWDNTLYRSTVVPILCDDSLKLAIWYTGRSAFTFDQVGHTEATFTAVIPPNATTYHVTAGDLQDGSGNLASTNSVAVLVADTHNNGFTSPQPNFPLSLGASWGSGNIVVGLWDLSADRIAGFLDGVTAVTNNQGFAPSQNLQLYWFPSLTLSSNVAGFTSYFTYSPNNNGSPVAMVSRAPTTWTPAARPTRRHATTAVTILP
jgi:hypothetical protein